MAKESKLENYFCKRAEGMGAVIRKAQWIGRRGAPDRKMHCRGFAAYVEFKAPGEKLRANQEREIAKLRAEGAIVLVIDSYRKADVVLTFLEFLCES